MHTLFSKRPLPVVLLVTSLLIAFAACSDDTPVGGGSSDHDAPLIENLTIVDHFHITITFDEDLDPSSAETLQNYHVVDSTDPTHEMGVAAAVLGDDNRTVTLATWAAMISSYTLDMIVSGVKDVHGNATTALHNSFHGTATPDTDPPVIVSTSPAWNSTAVPVRSAVVIQFSEPVLYNTNSSLTWTSPTGPVNFQQDGYYTSTITMVASNSLAYNATQTISLTGIKDRSDNPMADAEFSFTTARTPDTTKPTLVSSFPAHGSTNVDTTTTISLTFSEPMDRYHFQIDITPQILLQDYPGAWSNNDRTITLTLRDDMPLYDNRQYNIVVYPNGVFDLGGNTVPDFQRVLFTTGQKLEQGQISGRVKGDPNTQSYDPSGTIVLAEDYFSDTYDYGIVAGNDSYQIRNLPFGPYLVRGYFDSNRDGQVNIETGDAIGGYGANIDQGDLELEFIGIGEGDHVTGIDFQMYDPAAASGYTSYSGTAFDSYRDVYVGFFISASDAALLQNPIFVEDDYWVPGKQHDEYPDWVFNQVFQGFADGTYYVAAFLDGDGNFVYDPATDPAGVYGGAATPTALVMTSGKDYPGITIAMSDPSPAARVAALATIGAKWPAPAKNPGFQQFVDAFAKANAISTVSQNDGARRPPLVTKPLQ